MSVDPVRTHLKLPTAYGAPSNTPLLSWSSVVERLQRAEHYWLSTADRNAVPISRPLDGVWLDGVLYFGGDPTTRWRQNLEENPRASLFLNDAIDPVILEGSVVVQSLDSEHADLVAKSTQAKYGWGSVEQFRNESCVFTPLQAIAWIGLFQRATRFRFTA